MDLKEYALVRYFVTKAAYLAWKWRQRRGKAQPPARPPAIRRRQKQARAAAGAMGWETDRHLPDLSGIRVPEGWPDRPCTWVSLD